MAIFIWLCEPIYFIISSSFSILPWIPRSSGLLATLLLTKPTNGKARIVSPGCLMANVVAPHPVMPLLNTQFTGISDIHSVIHFAPDGAVLRIVSFTITYYLLIIYIIYYYFLYTKKISILNFHIHSLSY